jgi:hypothetical protein
MMMPAMTQPTSRLGGLGLGVASDGSLVPGRQKKLLLQVRPALPALALLLVLTWSQVQVVAGAAITFTGLVTRDMPAGPGGSQCHRRQCASARVYACLDSLSVVVL